MNDKAGAPSPKFHSFKALGTGDRVLGLNVHVPRKVGLPPQDNFTESQTVDWERAAANASGSAVSCDEL